MLTYIYIYIYIYSNPILLCYIYIYIYIYIYTKSWDHKTKFDSEKTKCTDFYLRFFICGTNVT